MACLACFCLLCVHVIVQLGSQPAVVAARGALAIRTANRYDVPLSRYGWSTKHEANMIAYIVGWRYPARDPGNFQSPWLALPLLYRRDQLLPPDGGQAMPCPSACQGLVHSQIGKGVIEATIVVFGHSIFMAEKSTWCNLYTWKHDYSLVVGT